MTNKINAPKVTFGNRLFNILLFLFCVQRTTTIFNQESIFYSIVPIVLALYCVIDAGSSFGKEIKKNRLYVIWQFLFTGFCFTSYLWSIAPATSNNNSFFVNIILMIPLSVYLSKHQNQKETLGLLVFYSLFVMLYSLLFGGLGMEASGDAMRLGNENMNANFFAIISVFSIYSLLTVVSSPKIIKFSLCLFFAIIILLSGSKKGFLMLLLGFFTLELTKRRKVRIFNIFLYLIVTIAIFLLLLRLPFVQETVGVRLMSLVDELLYDSGDSSSSERSDMITMGWFWILQEPIIGHGIDNFRYQFEVFSRYGSNTYSHNNYIEILHGVGIIGFILYYSLYYYIIKSLYRVKPYIFKYPILRFCVVFMAMLLFAEIALVTYNTRWAQLYILVVYSIINSYTNLILYTERNELKTNNRSF